MKWAEILTHYLFSDEMNSFIGNIDPLFVTFLEAPNASWAAAAHSQGIYFSFDNCFAFPFTSCLAFSVIFAQASDKAFWWQNQFTVCRLRSNKPKPCLCVSEQTVITLTHPFDKHILFSVLAFTSCVAISTLLLLCHRTSSELDLCGLIFPHFQL